MGTLCELSCRRRAVTTIVLSSAAPLNDYIMQMDRA
jgi:hypothetical protein